jgi:hypothetical protein
MSSREGPVWVTVKALVRVRVVRYFAGYAHLCRVRRVDERPALPTLPEVSPARPLRFVWWRCGQLRVSSLGDRAPPGASPQVPRAVECRRHSERGYGATRPTGSGGVGAGSPLSRAPRRLWGRSGQGTSTSHGPHPRCSGRHRPGPAAVVAPPRRADRVAALGSRFLSSWIGLRRPCSRGRCSHVGSHAERGRGGSRRPDIGRHFGDVSGYDGVNQGADRLEEAA